MTSSSVAARTVVILFALGVLGGAREGAPKRVRLALGPEPASLVLTWATDGAAVPQAICAEWSACAESECGAGAAEERRLAPRPRASYLGTAFLDAWLGQPSLEPRRLCVRGASVPFYDPGSNRTTQVIHSLVLEDLPVGRPFAYRVGARWTLEATAWSAWVAARGPAAPSAAEARLLVFGDLGLYNAPARPALIAEGAGPGFEDRPYDAVLHVGDLAYDLAAAGGSRGSRFLAAMEPLASRLPYMVVPGNHEAPHDFAHIRGLFRMPRRAASDNLFYSLDVGPVHLVVYNTEAFFWPGSFDAAYMRSMHAWLDRDLAAANRARARTPWVIVLGHRPLYCAAPLASTGRCDYETRAGQRGIPSVCPHNNPRLCRPVGSSVAPVEELFHKHGVDVAVYGHIHDYERYLPVYNYTVLGGVEAGPGNQSVYRSPRATVHVTAGGGGNSEMRKGSCPPARGRCDPGAPWCAFQSGFAPSGCESADHSFGRVAVYNATHLRWQQWSQSFGEVEDDWWIVQPNHGSFL